MLLKERFINRLNSDKADVTTTSILLWITFTVVLVTVVGGDLLWIMNGRGYRMQDCISGVDYYIEQGNPGCADQNQ
jgi:hypothetical protein